MKRVYVMTRNIASRLGSGSKLRCSKKGCGVAFRIGDRVVSVVRNGSVKVYHEGCFESLFIDV